MAEENNGSWPNQQTPQSSEQPHNEQPNQTPQIVEGDQFTMTHRRRGHERRAAHGDNPDCGAGGDQIHTERGAGRPVRRTGVGRPGTGRSPGPSVAVPPRT